ncbi:hypothetical protein DYB37_008279 [Aphanomyces astaci]|uniref:Dynamin-type G domain-containing protein n=1 Tax=Aphanomyces astaci TaxID=112090 RepID=A0A3R7EFQ5_APHAT|nr:hypothetical protein DYB35_007114 [Aphanomyces astaci]RHZ34775.1 hypothetical protein DYB37_008279 [Aphanomyces astaci]
MGDTSSGKSSVLSALSGITFPSSGNLTTRCPTQLILTQAKSFVGTVRLLRFNPAVESLPAKPIQSIEDVTACIESITQQLVDQGQAISDDAIEIKLHGPDFPDLTLTDLPGLVRTVGDNEDKAMISRVDKLLQRYLVQDRTIILAVVPANVDMHNTAIIQAAEEADPEGVRTISIITKPDLIDQGAEDAPEQNQALPPGGLSVVDATTVDTLKREAAVGDFVEVTVGKDKWQVDQVTQTSRSQVKTANVSPNAWLDMPGWRFLPELDLSELKQMLAANRGDELSIFLSYSTFANVVRQWYVTKWCPPMLKLFEAYQNLMLEFVNRAIESTKSKQSLEGHLKQVANGIVARHANATMVELDKTIQTESRPFTMNQRLGEVLMQLRTQPLMDALDALSGNTNFTQPILLAVFNETAETSDGVLDRVLVECLWLNRALGKATAPLTAKTSHEFIPHAVQAPKDVFTQCHPNNRADFQARVATFSSINWFAKPAELNLLTCARFGWINSGPDELACKCCGQTLSCRIDSRLGPEGAKKVAEGLRGYLTSHHLDTCPWKHNPSPTSFAQVSFWTHDSALVEVHAAIQQTIAAWPHLFLPSSLVLDDSFRDDLQRQLGVSCDQELESTLMALTRGSDVAFACAQCNRTWHLSTTTADKALRSKDASEPAPKRLKVTAAHVLSVGSNELPTDENDQVDSQRGISRMVEGGIAPHPSTVLSAVQALLDFA